MGLQVHSALIVLAANWADLRNQCPKLDMACWTAGGCRARVIHGSYMGSIRNGFIQKYALVSPQQKKKLRDFLLRC